MKKIRVWCQGREFWVTNPKRILFWEQMANQYSSHAIKHVKILRTQIIRT